MKKIKVVLVGAGSASFGRGTIADLLSSEELREAELTVQLVDIERDALERMFKFARMLKERYSSPVHLGATTDRAEALSDANYVIVCVSKKRYELWDRDFYLPFAYGFKQVFGECGGPGGAFHTLRSLHIVLPIARDMERLCPDALLINFTNPESRVCMGLSMLTKVRFVGLCHGAFGTLRTVARILDRNEEDIDITIGGLNHFHWTLKITDKRSGEDLYPEFHRRMAQSTYKLEPLTTLMYETFGLLPFPVDSHIGEYVGFGYDSAGPIWTQRTEGVRVEEERERYGVWMTSVERIQRVVDGQEPLTDELAQPSGELAIPIITDIEFDRARRELSVNIPNEGYAVENLPEDAIVEVPALVDATGLHPEKVGQLPEAIATLCRTQVSIQKLLVQAYAERSRRLLLQALAIDPVVDSIPRLRELVELMLRVEGCFLPEFTD